MSPSRLISAVLAAAILTVSCGKSEPVEVAPPAVEIVVPAGTQQRIDAGESVSVMPSQLELRVGERLVIRNDDVADQFIGPYLVKAGVTIEMTFGKPGTYEGMCELNDEGGYAIVVTA